MKAEKIRINYFSLAFRNLGRHKVKSALTMIAIVVGISLYIFVDGWLLGAEIDSMRNLVNFEIGAAKIYSKDFFKNKDELPTYEGFTNYEPIIQKLKDEGYNAAPHALFSGILLSKEQELPFLFTGVDPALEKEVFS